MESIPTIECGLVLLVVQGKHQIARLSRLTCSRHMAKLFIRTSCNWRETSLPPTIKHSYHHFAFYVAKNFFRPSDYQIVWVIIWSNSLPLPEVDDGQKTESSSGVDDEELMPHTADATRPNDDDDIAKHETQRLPSRIIQPETLQSGQETLNDGVYDIKDTTHANRLLQGLQAIISNNADQLPVQQKMPIRFKDAVGRIRLPLGYLHYVEGYGDSDQARLSTRRHYRSACSGRAF